MQVTAGVVCDKLGEQGSEWAAELADEWFENTRVVIPVKGRRVA